MGSVIRGREAFRHALTLYDMSDEDSPYADFRAVHGKHVLIRYLILSEPTSGHARGGGGGVVKERKSFRLRLPFWANFFSTSRTERGGLPQHAARGQLRARSARSTTFGARSAISWRQKQAHQSVGGSGCRSCEDCHHSSCADTDRESSLSIGGGAHREANHLGHH